MTTFRTSREEFHLLEWQARVWAAQQGYQIVETCPIPLPVPLRALPVEDVEFVSVTLASRLVGCHRSQLHVAIREGLVRIYGSHGHKSRVVSMREVRAWDRARTKLVRVVSKGVAA